MYKALGLDHEESHVYQFVLANSPVPRAKVIERFGGSTERLLGELAERHLTTGHELISACNPALALSGGVLRIHTEYTTAKSALDDLVTRFNENPNNWVAADNPVEVIRDPTAITKTFAEIRDTAVRELRAMYTYPYQFVTPLVDDVVEHTTTCRILVEPSVFSDPAARQDITKSHNSGCEVRVAPDDDLPTKMLVKDRELAIMPRDRETGAVLVIQPGLMMSLILAAFDARWAQGVPARAFVRRTGAEPGTRVRRPKAVLFDEDGLQILSMLADGATDSMIVKATGVSQRNLTRRIGQFLKFCGARSRFQLGFIAATSEWMPKRQAS
ncbi:hypothetical protein [Nonomuraea longicatena]|uniref:HTH luxR-type domain-containing protein n=1 Tax=Nonomuraea longicatena TaxID=83682 RepID=A0ABN1NY87_9ACTN